MKLEDFVENGLRLGIEFYNLEKPLGNEKMLSAKEITTTLENKDRVQICGSIFPSD